MLARTVFQALLGEFALQRGDAKLGSDAWSDLAVRTRDPRSSPGSKSPVSPSIRPRTGAFQAVDLRRTGFSQGTTDPISLLVLANRLDDLAPQLAQLLDKDKAERRLQPDAPEPHAGQDQRQEGVQSLVDKWQPLRLAEAHFAMAQAAANAGDNLRALNETEKSLQLRPDWETAAIACAQIQARHSGKTAIESLVTSSIATRMPARPA